jgi:hypothetical protein
LRVERTRRREGTWRCAHPRDSSLNRCELGGALPRRHVAARHRVAHREASGALPIPLPPSGGLELSVRGLAVDACVRLVVGRGAFRGLVGLGGVVVRRARAPRRPRRRGAQQHLRRAAARRRRAAAGRGGGMRAAVVGGGVCGSDVRGGGARGAARRGRAHHRCGRAQLRRGRALQGGCGCGRRAEGWGRMRGALWGAGVGAVGGGGAGVRSAVGGGGARARAARRRRAHLHRRWGGHQGCGRCGCRRQERCRCRDCGRWRGIRGGSDVSGRTARVSGRAASARAVWLAARRVQGSS